MKLKKTVVILLRSDTTNKQTNKKHQPKMKRLYIYIYCIWFFILWYMNLRGLFNAKVVSVEKQLLRWGYPRGVMVKAMDCGIVVREFVLQSRYYVHFRSNTLGKGMSPLILPAMG